MQLKTETLCQQRCSSIFLAGRHINWSEETIKLLESICQWKISLEIRYNEFVFVPFKKATSSFKKSEFVFARCFSSIRSNLNQPLIFHEKKKMTQCISSFFVKFLMGSMSRDSISNTGYWSLRQYICTKASLDIKHGHLYSECLHLSDRASLYFKQAAFSISPRKSSTSHFIDFSNALHAHSISHCSYVAPPWNAAMLPSPVKREKHEQTCFPKNVFSPSEISQSYVVVTC